MQYGYLEFLCLPEGNVEVEPTVVNAMILCAEGSFPNTYYETTRPGPYSDPRCWKLIVGEGPNELHYSLDMEDGEIASATQLTGDATYQQVTSENHYDKWWIDLTSEGLAVGSTLYVALANFVTAKGAIGVLGKTAPSANMWITRMIQGFSQNPANFFNSDGTPKSGLKGQAGKVLEQTKVINRWAKRARFLAYISIITEGVIYGFETGDWTTSIYNVAAGLTVTAVAAAIIAPVATATVGAATTWAAGALVSSGWIAAGAAASLLGPLVVVAATAIVVGVALYYLDKHLDITGRVADGMRLVGDAIVAGFNQFTTSVEQSLDKFSDAVNSGIEVATRTANSLFESLLQSIDDAASAPGRAFDDFARETSRYDPLGNGDFDRGLLYRLMQAFGHPYPGGYWRRR